MILTMTGVLWVVVERGDTLNKIAAQTGTTVWEILLLNPKIKNADLIYEGEAIMVREAERPATETYLRIR